MSEISDEVLEQLTAAVAESDYEWHDSVDPDDVVLLLEHEGALAHVVGTGGDVNAEKFSSALRTFVIDNPNWIKDPSEERFVGPHGPSGGNVGSRRNKYRTKGYDEKSLRERYPALNQ